MELIASPEELDAIIDTLDAAIRKRDADAVDEVLGSLKDQARDEGGDPDTAAVLLLPELERLVARIRERIAAGEDLSHVLDEASE